ncbi:MAG: hypothetical protein OXT70_01090 [Chloroflexota bacterium]|nr:hypothetical protein [Chloroflexota bacterium]
MEAHVTGDGTAETKWHCHLDAKADPAAGNVWITGPAGSDDASLDDGFRVEFAAERGGQSATIVLTRWQLERIAVDSNVILAR